MDDISRIKRSKGEPDADADEVGGYKRSSVLKLISELEKQREMLVAELDKTNAGASVKDRESAAVNENAEKELQEAYRAKEEELKAREAMLARREKEMFSRSDSAVASFRKGDNALVIESVYNGLSLDLEKMRDDILQELKYGYKQDMSIYDDLAEKIESLKTADFSALEESLKPLHTLDEKLNALQVLNGLDEKLKALQTVDLTVLAEKMPAPAALDYDVLAERVAALMAPYAASTAVPAQAQLKEIERRIDEVQITLAAVTNVRQTPELRKLDALLDDYKKTLTYNNMPDILILCNEIRLKASRHIAGGNVLRGEGMLADLDERISNVYVSGSAALVVIEDAIKTHDLPDMCDNEAYVDFKNACAKLERSPAVCGRATVEHVVQTKKELLQDIRLAEKDERTKRDLFKIFESVPERDLPDADAVAQINALKKDLMSFSLAYFVDFEPVASQPEKYDNVDTQKILSAISDIKLPETVTIARRMPDEIRTIAMSEDLIEAKQASPSVRVKKPRVLRPAVSSKDGKTEHVAQPLRVVHRSIRAVNENPEALSNVLTDQIAARSSREKSDRK